MDYAHVEGFNNTPVRTAGGTAEKRKDTFFSVAAVRKKLKTYEWRDNHPLQRHASQWSNLYKSELISDMLQGKGLTQIIVSEEIKNGVIMYWLIDGKQRCTNIDEFCMDAFAISKNVQRYMIPYQTRKRDENGEVMYNEDGFPIPEYKVFDIRRKKFSQLPEELKDKILEYQIPTMLNMDCDKKEIAYDIARFNRSRPMNKAQSGWIGMEEVYAEFVDNILKSDVFKSDFVGTNYTNNNNKTGMLRRLVVESIMTINYLDDFTKDFRHACEYLTEEANDSIFADFYDLVERFKDVANEETKKVFNIKNSFIWFTIFNKCSEYGITDEQFVEFVTEFNTSLHNIELDGIDYNMLDKDKSSKDKSAVIAKLNHIETLMCSYFNVDKIERVETEFTLDSNWEDYVDAFSKTDFMVTTDETPANEIRLAAQTIMLLNGETDLSDDAIQEYMTDNLLENNDIEDVEFYMGMLNSYSLELESTYTINPESIPTLVAIIKYVVDEDLNEECVLPLFKKWTNGISNANYKEKISNYMLMVEDLKKEVNEVA